MSLFKPWYFSWALVVTHLGAVLQVALADRQFNITNLCPSSIPIHINGESQGTLETGQSIEKTFSDSWNGLIYSNVNAPSGNTGVGTTKIAFVNQAGYYYILKDTTNFNTGVSVVPSTSALQSNGFCPRVTCNSKFCANSYSEEVTHFPAPSGSAPTPPLFSCSADAFSLLFCPTGAFPRNDGTVLLHPNGQTWKCLDARDGVAANGTLVQAYDCNGSPSQSWKLSPGDTQVELAGTGFCLDAGSSPSNNVPMKIWKCISKLPAQTWTYNARSQLALKVTGQCLDLTDGNYDNGNVVQTYQCWNGNVNQIWTVG